MLFLKKLKSILKFLNNTNKRAPTENSKPAKANKKKDNEYRFISSFIPPNITDITYKMTQISSENKSTDKKLKLFSKNINIEIQNAVFQKISHDCILRSSNF